MQVALSFAHFSGLFQGLAFGQGRVLFQELGGVFPDVLEVEVLQRCLLLLEVSQRDDSLMLT